jgi:hypothetical protein
VRRIIVSIAVTVVLLPSVALAATYVDPNDTRGPLDIRTVSFTNLRNPARVGFELTTFETWTVRRCIRAQQLEDGCSIRFWLDTRGRPAWRPTGRGLDHWLIWGSRRCTLRDPSTLQTEAFGIARKTPDSVSCSIRRSTLDARKKLRWFAETTWAFRDDGSFASDYTPATGWYG